MAIIIDLLSRRAATLGLVLMLLVILVGIKEATVDAKPQKEKVVENLPYGTEPVELLEIKLSGKNLKLGGKVSDGDDWLQNLAFKLKNKANKQIVFVEIALDLPETITSGPQMAYIFRLGQNPVEKKHVRAPLLLMPDDSLLVTVADEYDKLKAFVQDRHQITDINKAVLRLSFLGFSDGTAWSAGEMVRPDPNNSRRYIPINNQ